ncbi:MAG: flagellar filament capping protein FliD [Pseudomonadota bacterium]
MALTATGIGSGLDITNLVKQLVQVEGQPVENALDRRETQVDTRISALGKLKSSMSTFKSALSKLDDLSTFSVRKTTNTNETAFSVSASSTASVGTYSFEVVQLATAQKQASAGFSSSSATVGSGSLTLDVGGSAFTVALGAGSTLANIRDAINNASDNTGVSASIVNADDGSGGTVSRLMLTSQETGTANSVNITINDDDGNNTDASGLSALAFTQQTAAQDAIVRLDGYTITRSSNTISDAVDGMTFTLKSVTTSAAQVGVETDTDAIETTLQEFVDGYNAMRQVMADLGKYDPETKKAGALQGDALLRNLQQGLRRDVADPVASLADPLNTLAGFGIKFDQYGVMSLDTTEFGDAIESAADSMTRLSSLFGATDGLVARATARMDVVIQSGGILDTQLTQLKDQKSSIDDQRERLDYRLSRLETQLLKQFNSMDVMVAQYNSTGSYLAQQLAALPGFG